LANTIYDRDIREPLFDFLEETYGRIRIIEEKTMGKSRADIVLVLEDALWGIEIKSDADTYARLSGQVKDYDRFFVRNVVVVGTSHAMHIEEHVPPYWGIITVEEVDGKLDFYILRKAQDNPKASLKNRLGLLWRMELDKLQQWADMPKYKEKSRPFVIDKILARIPDKIDESDLNWKISEILFERDYTTVQEDIREYRKSELKKAIEKETDPQKKLELMVEQASKAGSFKRKARKRRK
jgi:hypothetical protein